MDLRDRTLWPLLAVAAWMILMPAALGFLAGWELDRWHCTGCWSARVGFAAAGALIGWAIAWSLLVHLRHRRR